MYGFKEFHDLSSQQLIRAVDQKRVFEDIFGEPILEKPTYYKSVFRGDEYPTCYFEFMSDGLLFFVDFGEHGRTHRTCLHAVQEFYGLSFGKALQFLHDKYLLNVDTALIPKERAYNSEDYYKSPFKIVYNKKQFTRDDIKYWSQFGISTTNLIEDNVFSINSFRSIGSRKSFTVNIYKYGYAIDFIDAVKIYQPYNSKFKWYTNCNQNHIGNIDNIPPKGDRLIITKSYKDHRVIRNLFPDLNVIWFHNEGCTPDDDILLSIINRYTKITLFYDNDSGGIKSAKSVQEVLNEIRQDCCDTITLPKREKDKKLYGEYIKDPAEFRRREGRTDTIKMLEKIGIYGNT